VAVIPPATIGELKLTASVAHQVTPRRYRELSQFQQMATTEEPGPGA